MATRHRELVEELEAALGHEEAVRLGREALFGVGESLGKRTRQMLGVGDNPRDLTQAAEILYRVLGIKFHLNWLGDSSAELIVDECALAKQYTKLTCEVLCATDEGVIKGLQPNCSMKFKMYMTGGCEKCHADITFGKKEETA